VGVHHKTYVEGMTQQSSMIQQSSINLCGRHDTAVQHKPMWKAWHSSPAWYSSPALT